jgi:hypothetical protein
MCWSTREKRNVDGRDVGFRANPIRKTLSLEVAEVESSLHKVESVRQQKVLYNKNLNVNAI